MTNRECLRGLPKAELHVHLEGTITPKAFAQIARRHGAEVPDDPKDLFLCSDFASFLDAFLKVVRVLKDPEDFAEPAAQYLTTSADEGVRHVELFFSPATIRHFHPDADLKAIVRAIHSAQRRVSATHGVSSFLIFDMVRNLGEELAKADLDLAVACSELGVVGIGLGGDERRFPARAFQSVFERASDLGLRRTVHAGEADGSQSIEDAVELLHAERIGHGVAAAGKPDLQRRLRDRGVTIDACPASNLVTGAWDGQAPHPLAEFLEAGIAVTLGSDDPTFFGRSLLDEYVAASERGMGRTQLAEIARYSLVSSFAPEKEKRVWLAELDAYLKETDYRIYERGAPGLTR